LNHVLELLMMSIVCFTCLRVLEYFDHLMHELVITEWDLSQEKVIAKWRGITHSMGVTRSGDEDKDLCIGFQSTRTFADLVYGRIWVVLYIGAKAYLFALFVVFAMMREQAPQFVVLGIALFGINAVFAAYHFWDKMGSLMKLFLHKPFWVGELVSIGTDSGVLVAGFVEQISLSYVVIRNFESKQVFVPMQLLANTCVYNWSRRPTKPVKLRLTLDGGSDAKAVSQLTENAQKWIDSKKEINAKGYTKCNIVGLSNGFDVEIIFFPLPGVHKNELRQEFLVALKGMANALNLRFVATAGVSVYSSGTVTSSQLGLSAAAGSFGR